MIKKSIVSVFVVVLLSVLTGCLGEGETVKEVDPATGKVTEKTEDQVIGEVLEKDKWFEKNVIYSGNGIVTYNFDGNECPANGPLTVTLQPDGQAVVIHVGNCMKYGENGCATDGDKCENTVIGTYSRNNSLIGDPKIISSSCNNASFTARGEGTFNNDTSSGQVSCSDNGEIGMFVEWNSLSKLQ